MFTLGLRAIGGLIGSGLAEFHAIHDAISSAGAETVANIATLGAIAGIPPFQMPAPLGSLPQLFNTGSANGGSSFFGGTNYLGLADNPLIKVGSAIAALRHGSSFSGSRTTTGTNRLHLLAEGKIAEFMGEDDACLLPSGAHANYVLMEALGRRHRVLFYEKSAHPSIISAARASFARTESFDQDNIADLLRALRGMEGAVVAMNGIDPMSGRIAPLDRIVTASLAGDVSIVVDDCHAVGVLGANGRGTAEHFGIKSKLVYQSATMSKAFGCHGGFVAGSKGLCGEIRRTSAYIGASALPASDSAACFMSLCIALQNPQLRTRLRYNAEYASRQLRALGLNIPYDGTPVLQISNIVGDEANSLCRQLRRNGIYLFCIRYPKSDSPERLRIVINAAHTKKDIDRLCSAIRQFQHSRTP